jgi:hypothetical protein
MTRLSNLGLVAVAVFAAVALDHDNDGGFRNRAVQAVKVTASSGLLPKSVTLILDQLQSDQFGDALDKIFDQLQPKDVPAAPAVDLEAGAAASLRCCDSVGAGLRRLGNAAGRFAVRGVLLLKPVAKVVVAVGMFVVPVAFCYVVPQVTMAVVGAHLNWQYDREAAAAAFSTRSAQIRHNLGFLYEWELMGAAMVTAYIFFFYMVTGCAGILGEVFANLERRALASDSEKREIKQKDALLNLVLGYTVLVVILLPTAHVFGVGRRQVCQSAAFWWASTMIESLVDLAVAHPNPANWPAGS